MDKIFITNAGLARLEAELLQLKTEARPAIQAAIAEARAHGDLSENAEYHAAKEKQGFIEGRINELEDKMMRFEAIDPTRIKSDKIQLGATVTLVDVETNKTVVYVLVGPDEADLERGHITTLSPLGRALLGKQTGDEVVFAAPAGKRTYEVKKVAYVAL